MATVATANVKKPTPIANVTGTSKGRGGQKGPRGPLTKPLFPSNQERMGAITNAARAIAIRNGGTTNEEGLYTGGGYVNADMIYRELKDHPVYQETVHGPEGVQPMKAYDLLTVAKVKDFYGQALDLLKEKGIDPHAAPENGGPKKGALPHLANAKGKAFVDADEL